MRTYKSPKIIVIGAGVAGMSAAQKLQKNGLDVTILEGLDRVGGRVFPVRFGERYIDTGATWIHYYKNNPLFAFAKMSDWNVIEDSYEPFEIWNAEIKAFLGKEKHQLMEWSEAVRAAAIDFFLNNEVAVSTGDFFDNYIINKDWNRPTIQAVKFLYSALLETDYGGNIDQVALTDERYLNKFGNLEETDALLVGSFKKMLDSLKQGLDIRLNQTIQGIDYQQDTIFVTTQNQVFECDKVIVTVSLGVLKQGNIQFRPTLSAEKRNAIAGFQYGKLEKIILTFEEQFWGESRLFYYMNHKKPNLAFPMILDFTAVVGQPTLGIYYAADFAKSIENESDEVILEKVVVILKEMFGDKYLEPIQTYISHWSTNEFFKGAYSFSSGLNNKTYVETLAKPIDNKVFFAGEATSLEGQAYVHGAYLSGIREAERLISQSKMREGVF